MSGIDWGHRWWSLGKDERLGGNINGVSLVDGKVWLLELMGGNNGRLWEGNGWLSEVVKDIDGREEVRKLEMMERNKEERKEMMNVSYLT